MLFNVAIVGATGKVGREMLNILFERSFPVRKITVLASTSSEGMKLNFGQEKILVVQDLSKFDFSDIDIVLSSPSGKVSAQHSPRAVKAGAIVIDNTSYFRMHDNVPLVVPEVNPHTLEHFLCVRNGKSNIERGGIIANPNCSTIQMVMVLNPLHNLAQIKRVNVSTYQSISGAGKHAMDALYEQTKAICSKHSHEKKHFLKQIAFNAMPQIDNFMDDGSTREEWKMRVETTKILDCNIRVAASCVRVPIFIGHGETIHIEFAKPLSVSHARSVLSRSPGISVVDQHNDKDCNSIIECVGKNEVFVSRIRKNTSINNGLQMWIVSDNLRKGAALNAIQIAEMLISIGLQPKM